MGSDRHRPDVVPRLATHSSKCKANGRSNEQQKYGGYSKCSTDKADAKPPDKQGDYCADKSTEKTIFHNNSLFRCISMVVVILDVELTSVNTLLWGNYDLGEGSYYAWDAQVVITNS
ncbi:hypothetical protein WH95_00575 [Kiloniella litopenaei]|uniref:Uncharacterized protein n=1 Tax=Kiloniella litopenaei TaxID=1549748 RepID=A0A0M2RF34_9PROT|nr:hypothetical protein WH95_00575 [Kiloniella litopenaei]